MDDGADAGPTIFMNWDPFYSYGYGYGYRYGTYGFGNRNAYGSTWYSGYPLVVVRPGQSVSFAQEPGGRMVRGKGYTRGASGGGSTASPTSRTSGASGGSSRS